MREHTNQDQGGSNEQYSQLGQEFGRHVIQLTSELLVKTGQPKSLSEMERGIRQMLLKVGQFLLGAWLALQKEPYPAETKGCPHCKAEAEYQFRREASLLTLVGVVLYKRAYYAKGYQIGSGTVESGCKQIVTQRLKVAGAIWDLDNCIKTAKARAALLSNQWSAITDRREHLPLTA
jgi:hypothetical protein